MGKKKQVKQNKQIEQYDRIGRSEERVRKNGEIFTPTALVNEMLDLLIKHQLENGKSLYEVTDGNWVDPSCGNGQFLVEVVRRKLEAGHTPEHALETTYGVELMPDNTGVCRVRVLQVVAEHLKQPLDIVKKKYYHIVKQNIVCGEALKQWDFENWKPRYPHIPPTYDAPVNIDLLAF